MRLEKRILVVDDDDAIRALLRTVLRRRGFAVDTARNGVEALEEMGARRYALIVLDLMMPRMNGFELLEKLVAESIMTRPRVLILTAGLDTRPFDSTLVVGMIHKPFDVELLLDTVAGCLTSFEALAQPEETNVTADSVAPLLN
ncbi:MAG TPA: response regulator [Thermoanaerobaculia bacterium]